MMLGCVPATFDIDRTSPAPRGREALINQAYFASAPWQFTALMKLHQLANTPTVNQADANLAPSQSTFMIARASIAKLPAMDLPSPSVCPVSGGSIGMVWSLGMKQLEVIFDHDQIGTYVLTKGNSIIDDGEISTERIDSLQRALNNLLCP